jgi:hypothetical protein
MSAKNSKGTGKQAAKATGAKAPKKAKAVPVIESEAPPVAENEVPVTETETPVAEVPTAEGSAETTAADETPVAAATQTTAAEVEPPTPTGKLSALDAAARVLEETGRPMTCKELIATMALKGYWTTPGGKTPWATLYAAILRELSVKGKQARFAKASRGHFTRAQPES